TIHRGDAVAERRDPQRKAQREAIERSPATGELDVSGDPEPARAAADHRCEADRADRGPRELGRRSLVARERRLVVERGDRLLIVALVVGSLAELEPRRAE